MRIGNPTPWIDVAEEVQRVLVRLGEQLFDERLLAPPYDERTFHTDEELVSLDAGPARLCALMTLAAYANELGHPRAGVWIDLARAGMCAVPPTVFSPHLRTLWARLDALHASP